uniref:Uncharacterized protein n=1 Tax=Oryza brachyantha TaxID=4533 RepID=J3MQ96_ORYBR
MWWPDKATRSSGSLHLSAPAHLPRPRVPTTAAASLFDGAICTKFSPCRTCRQQGRAHGERGQPPRELLHVHPPFTSAASSLFVHSLELDEPKKAVVNRWRMGRGRRPAPVSLRRGRPARGSAATRTSSLVDLDGGGGASVTSLPVPASG